MKKRCLSLLYFRRYYCQQGESRFYCQYHGEAIPIEELHDLTFHFDIPIYEIEPRTNQIVVKTSIQVNDTTDKVAYFAESFKVVFFEVFSPFCQTRVCEER